jgi:hypothetical protein
VFGLQQTGTVGLWAGFPQGGTDLDLSLAMKTAATWLRGALVGSVFALAATGEPAEKVSFAAQTEPVLASIRLPDPLPAPLAFLAEAEAVPAPLPAVDPFPARSYGNLEDVACLVSLESRGIVYERYGRHAHGVQTPVKLLGPLHGVRFVHAEATDWLQSAHHEILDCRLVLALDDLAALLARHGVRTVVHYGVYRGDLPLPAHGRPLHHVAAMAMDVAAFEKDDGTRLAVRRDWSGRVGARPCDANEPNATNAAHASPRPNDRAEELHGILCDIVDEKIFHQVLTPNHDASHRDHFHLEVMRETEWTLVE